MEVFLDELENPDRVGRVLLHQIIPAVMHALQGVDYWNREVPMAWDWAAHLVFGASLALFPGIQAKVGGADWSGASRSTPAPRPRRQPPFAAPRV